MFSPFVRSYASPEKEIDRELQALHAEILQERKGNSSTPPVKEEKIKNKIRELEELSANHSAVFVTWREHGSLLVLFDNLAAIHCVLTDGAIAEVEKIHVDRSAADIGSDTVLAADMDVVSNVLVAATRGGRMLLFDGRKQGGKLATAGSKLGDFQVPCSVELPSVVTGLSINCSSNLVLAVCERHLVVLSLAPTGKGGPRNAMHHLVVALADPALGHFNSHGARFSHLIPTTLMLVQQDSLEGSLTDATTSETAPPSQPYYAARTFEYSRKECCLVTAVSAPISGISGKVTAVEWSCLEDQVVVGVDNGSVILQDLERGTLRRFALIPEAVTSLRWHPTGALLAAAFGTGQLAVLDGALQPLYIATDRMPDLAVDFRAIQGSQTPVLHMEWSKRVSAAETGTSSAKSTVQAHLGAMFDRGSMAVVRVAMESAKSLQLRTREVVAQHLLNGVPQQALAVLECCTNAQEMYYGLLRLAANVLCINSVSSAGKLAEGMISLVDSPVLALDAQHHGHLSSLLRTLSHRILREGKGVPAYRIARTFDDIMLAKDAILLAGERKEPHLTAAIREVLREAADVGDTPSTAATCVDGSEKRSTERAEGEGEQSRDGGFAYARDVLRMVLKDEDFRRAAGQIAESDWDTLSNEDAFLLGLYFAGEGRRDDASRVHQTHHAHWHK